MKYTTHLRLHSQAARLDEGLFLVLSMPKRQNEMPKSFVKKKSYGAFTLRGSLFQGI